MGTGGGTGVGLSGFGGSAGCGAGSGTIFGALIETAARSVARFVGRLHRDDRTGVPENVAAPPGSTKAETIFLCLRLISERFELE